MQERPPITLVLPRMTRWMKILSIYSGVVWIVLVIYTNTARWSAFSPFTWLAFAGSRIVPHAELWRMVTYVLIDDPRGLGPLWSILAFWLIGAPVEQSAGPRTVLALAVAGTLGGSIAALLASLLSPVLGMEPVVGMAPIAGALLAGWGYLNANQQASFFPGMPPMRGRTLALVFVGIAVFFAVLYRSPSSFASVGGIAAGAAWMWLARRIGGGRTTGTARRRRGSGERLRLVEKPGAREDRTRWN